MILLSQIQILVTDNVVFITVQFTCIWIIFFKTYPIW